MNKESSLMREIIALENKLDGSRQASERDREVTSELDTIIAELEREACGTDYMNYMDDDLDVIDDVDYDDDDDMDYMDDDMDYMDDDIFASELPTEDHHSEVEKLTNDTDQADAAETNQVASWKAASVRLDRVASYIEKGVEGGEDSSWLKVAYAIDKIADSIDEKIKEAI